VIHVQISDRHSRNRRRIGPNLHNCIKATTFLLNLSPTTDDPLALHASQIYQMIKLLLTTSALIAFASPALAETTVHYADVKEWAIAYDANVGAGSCQAYSFYPKANVNLFILSAYDATTHAVYWILLIRNKEWTWTKGKEFDVIVDVHLQNGSVKRWPVHFRGQDDGGVISTVSKDLINALGSDKKGEFVTFRDTKTNNSPIPRGLNLDYAGAALASVISCLKSRAPIAVNAPSNTPRQGKDNGSTGTGFFVAKNYVLTNNHVIKNCSTQIKVKYPGF